MFDKIIIVLAASSLLRNSQTEMLTAEAHRLASPLVLLLRTSFVACSALPIQIRKNSGPAEDGRAHSVAPTQSPSWA